MRIRLLGPVQLEAAGQVLAVGPSKQQCLLAALSVDVGRPVSADTLIDRVWGEQTPANARDALQVYVARLRARLTAVAESTVLAETSALPGTGEEVVGTPQQPGAARITRCSGGYLLDLDPDDVDAHRFQRLVTATATTEDPLREQRARRHALDLWHGEALQDVAGLWAQGVRQRLTHQRLDVLRAWATAEIEQGRASVTIPELHEAAATNPLVEPLTALLITALISCGRRAEALAAYESTRRHLAEELGTQPDRHLRALHEALLQDEEPPGCVPDTTPVGGSLPAELPRRTDRSTGVRPAQLPSDVHGFTGRTSQLAHLDALLDSAQTPSAVVITAVSGTAGVGKTALATHWAHRVRARFPDGQLYVNLRGYHPTGRIMEPFDAVRGFLHALGVPHERVPPEPDTQVGLYRSLLADRRMLVVLDNAREAEQVRPLLPGAPGCLTLVTSRNRLTGLIVTEGAHSVALDVLPREEARELLARRLGRDRVDAEPEAVDRIVTACARLPLALTIAAARAQESSLSLDALATALDPTTGGLDPTTGEPDLTTGGLDAFDTGDPMSAMRGIFSWSYATLSPGAARVFRLLGLHTAPTVSVVAAAGLAGLPTARVTPLLAELVLAQLVTEPAPGRYGFHDLLRVYAREQAHTHDSPEERHAAVTRLLDHYTGTAYRAAQLLHPQREPSPLPPPEPSPGTLLEHLDDHDQALSWLDDALPTLLAAVRHAVDAGFDTHACQLAWALDTFLDRQGLWNDQAAVWETALHAATRLAHPAAQADAHRFHAWADLRLGRYAEAQARLQQALDLFTQVDHPIGQAYVHHSLALLHWRQDRSRQALDHARQTLRYYRAAGDDRRQAFALNSIGWYHTQLGDPAQALSYCEQALEIQRELGDRYGQASTWDSLGFVHHRLGQQARAEHCYRQALDLFRGLHERFGEAEVLTHLGDVHRATGDLVATRDAWAQALEVLTELHHPDADALRDKLHELDAAESPSTPRT